MTADKDCIRLCAILIFHLLRTLTGTHYENFNHHGSFCRIADYCAIACRKHTNLLLVEWIH